MTQIDSYREIDAKKSSKNGEEAQKKQNLADQARKVLYFKKAYLRLSHQAHFLSNSLG
ncbi:MAG: hypothetical protein K0S08_308 [Gammaproteobacteria bacterium]|jgi:hypothetical protein|nr:hypothetical protein [Gammaproteobacteria bacterium]